MKGEESSMNEIRSVYIQQQKKRAKGWAIKVAVAYGMALTLLAVVKAFSKK